MEEKLRALGLSEKEIAVYLSVLRRKRVTPARVAIETGISRPTVYSVAASLVSKKLLTEDLGGKTTYLVAEPPERLLKNIELRKRELIKEENIASEVIRELESLSGAKKYAIPRVRYVEENDLDEFFRSRDKIWSESIEAADNIWWGFQDKTFLEFYKPWVDWAWKQPWAKYTVKVITNESRVEESMSGKYSRRLIKFWDKQTKFTSSTWAIGDYIVFTYTQEKPHYLVEIHDKVAAYNLREVFKNLWEEI